MDYFTIDKSGTLIFDDSSDSEELEHLLEALKEKGFVGESVEPERDIIDNGFSVSLPIDKVNIYNLKNLLESKKTLICKALMIDSLQVDVGETRVTFPWFRELLDVDKVKAYTHFISDRMTMSLLR